MALNFTTLFARIGKGVFAINTVNVFRGTTLPTEWEDYVEQYDAEVAAVRAALGDEVAALSQAQQSLDSFQSWVGTALGNTIIVMTDAESPLQAKTLANGMAELIRLMKAGSQTVDASTVSATATAGGSNVGTGKLVVSVLNGDGKALEYAYDETIDVIFSNTTTAILAGEAAASGKMSSSWPAGSACKKTAAVVSPGGSGDLLTNGTFETFTVANVPDNWTISTGVAGTDVLSEASVIYSGAKAVAIVGDGSTLTALTQTLTGLAARTPYAINLFGKMSATPAAGVLTVDLYDGSGVINDEAGNANSFTIDLTTLGTTYAAKNGVFRLPEPVPATVTLRLRLSTALSASRTLYLDHAAFAAMSQLYAAGPYTCLFAGAIAFSLDDVFSLVVVNNYAGALQTAFWRCFDMPTLGMMLPSDSVGSETILDSVIS